MLMGLIFVFDDNKGAECSKCTLSTIEDEKEVCVGLASRPVCAEEGCRANCPLIKIN
ncbi:conserved hypothetical protein [Clostridium neonatale]|uniref:hypothetical protein n=1 Tax=Clostridium neonatale TaxID=137838 RepID=UPI00291B6FE7|nr:hypothetical protein [Clostridium neonatale]CAI3224410.1 conserved hypothetical protein [Clostridium neonatale]